MAVAIALSIAVHEVVAGAIPASPDRSPVPRESVLEARVLTIRRLATPTPRPIPIRIEHLVFTHVSRPALLREGTAGAPRRAASHPVRLTVRSSFLSVPYATKPVWDTGATTGTGS
ncbi:MAG TPA: hypothetical protein VGI15_03165, partial [Candidatus Cybelea sp.]